MIRLCISLLAVCAIVPASALGQCDRQWFPMVAPRADGTVPGPNAAVNAVAVLPSGDLVLAGDFTAAGDVAANHIVILHGQEWIPLGDGLDQRVQALAVLRNGDILAGGDFTVAGFTLANHIVRWDGSAWSAMGDGVDVPVSAIAVTPAGALYAGGGPASSEGLTNSFLFRWNGTSWPIVGGGADAPVRALLANADESVVVAGEFHRLNNNNISTFKIARWTGSNWTTYRDGLGPYVYAAARAPNGDLIAAGSFTSIYNQGAANGVARWNGTAWQALGGGITGSSPNVRAVLALPNGDVVIGGEFASISYTFGNSVRTLPTNYMAKWNGSRWDPIGSGMLGYVHALAQLNAQGDFVAVGRFTKAQGVAATRIARYATLSGASAPVITTQPLPLQGCGSQQPMRTLSVTASSSNSLPLRYQWRRNGHDLCNSSSVSGVNSPDLVLTRSGTEGGAYEAVVFTEQGCVTSSLATFVDCAADFNCSGQLEVADLMEYVTSWLSGDLRADRNRDSQLTYSDLYYFVGDWFRGCGY